MLYIGFGLVLTILLTVVCIKFAALQKRLSRVNAEVAQYKMHDAIIKEGYPVLLDLIDNQFTERVRVLNHLHDNLGSMLAVLKLNFENLKIRTDGVLLADYSLYERTDELLEEAYNKVQLLSYPKNEGAFAENSLVPAIKIFAEKVTGLSGIPIQVASFGLAGRIDNDIEVLAFMAVQETVHNLILHSVAANVQMNLTMHDSYINIIVEDDGRSLSNDNTSGLNLRGLTLIKQRIKRKGGSLTVDNGPGKVTTVIINIPI